MHTQFMPRSRSGAGNCLSPILISILAACSLHPLPGQVEGDAANAVARPVLSLTPNQLSTSFDDWVYASDGNILAYSSILSGVTQIVDVSTKRTIASIPRRGRLAMSQDGHIAAVGTDKGEVWIWDIHGYRRLPGPLLKKISAMAISTDGRWVASGDIRGAISFWDTSTARVMWTNLVGAYGIEVSSLAVSSDGQRLLVGRGNVARQDISSEALDAVYKELPSISKDRRWWVGSQILDGSNGELLCVLDRRVGTGLVGYGISTATMSSDGSVAATLRESGSGVFIWHIPTNLKDAAEYWRTRKNQPLQLSASEILRDETFTSIAISQSGSMIAAFSPSDSVLRIVDAKGKKIAMQDAGERPYALELKGLQFVRGDQQLALTKDGIGSFLLSTRDLKVNGSFSESRDVPVPIVGFLSSPSGRYVLARGEHLSELWDKKSRTPVFKIGSERTSVPGLVQISKTPQPCDVTSASFSSDESLMAVILCSKTILILDVTTGGVLARYEQINGVQWLHADDVALSRQGAFLIAFVSFGQKKGIAIWNRTADTARLLPLDSSTTLQTHGFDKSEEWLWTVLVHSRADSENSVRDGSFQQYIRIGISDERQLPLVEQFEACDRNSCGFNGTAVATGGAVIAYASKSGATMVRYVDDKKQVALPDLSHVAEGPAAKPVFSFDQKLLVFVGAFTTLYDLDKRSIVWQRRTSEIIGASPRSSVSAQFLHDGSLLMLADGTGYRIMLDGAHSILRVDSYEENSGAIAQVAELGATNVAIASPIGLTIYSETSVHPIMTLTALNEGPWMVTSPDGWFDANDFDALSTVSWVTADNPFAPMPIEIFMRDYYQPRLLPRLSGCEEKKASDTAACDTEFKKTRPLASLDRTQPSVGEPEVKREGGNSDKVTVRVRVKSVTSAVQKDAQGRYRQSGVYDVRLFRDGQLVRWAPRDSTKWQELSSERGDQPDGVNLESWQHAHEITAKRPEVERVEADGTMVVRFEHVPLPHRAGQKQVEWSAYAFNDDRVKSETKHKAIPLPSRWESRKGTAYVITVGVNRTQSGNKAWDLQFAARDARQMSRVVSEDLQGTMQRQGRDATLLRVVPIRLVTDDGGPQNGELPARQAYLKAVLQLLAGQEPDSTLKAEILKVARIERAQPEDLVLLTVSSHGYTDHRGTFHFVLGDVNVPQKVTPTLDQQTLSSDQLSAWLREVDAGELVLVVDACQSETTIQTEGFKPGPMGSRGLGQLAYDKGMRVLAASKAKESAFELGTDAQGHQIDQGLLSYALVQEGLAEKQADTNQDGEITVGEWLRYAEQEVPRLFAEGYARGGVQRKGAPATALDHYLGKRQGDIGGGGEDTPARYQQPTLFDFDKALRDTVLIGK